MIGRCCPIARRVYRSYHSVHSAGRGNVWCAHCDWRERPPLLIPPSPVTRYQRERHSSAGKAIPCSLVCFLRMPPFWVLYSEASLLPLTPVHFFWLIFFFQPLQLSPSFTLSAPLDILPYKQGRIWVCGKGLEFVCGKAAGREAEIIAMVTHKNKPAWNGWERVRSFPGLLLQSQREEPGEESDN